MGAAFAQSGAEPQRIRDFTLAGALAACLPDLDIFIRSSTDPILYLEYHRQFTHSLLFIPIGAGLCALLLYPLTRRRLSYRETFLACLLGYASHGLLDACTSYGTQLFWPFSDMRVAWNWIAVVDPLFTLPLLLLVAIGCFRRSRTFAVMGLCWGLVYLGIGALQHQRATELAQSLAAERGHEPARMLVKPGFANLLLWKSLYEADGRFYADGIHAGLAGAVCDGESIDALVIGRDLSWLNPDSRQARDLQRFRWYSQDWLALDPEDPFYVVDVRYASLPDRISPLWGLQISPDAGSDTHAVWRVMQSRRQEDLNLLFGLILGRGCRTLAH